MPAAGDPTTCSMARSSRATSRPRSLRTPPICTVTGSSTGTPSDTTSPISSASTSRPDKRASMKAATPARSRAGRGCSERPLAFARRHGRQQPTAPLRRGPCCRSRPSRPAELALIRPFTSPMRASNGRSRPSRRPATCNGQHLRADVSRLNDGGRSRRLMAFHVSVRPSRNTRTRLSTTLSSMSVSPRLGAAPVPPPPIIRSMVAKATERDSSRARPGASKGCEQQCVERGRISERRQIFGVERTARSRRSVSSGLRPQVGAKAASRRMLRQPIVQHAQRSHVFFGEAILPAEVIGSRCRRRWSQNAGAPWRRR